MKKTLLLAVTLFMAAMIGVSCSNDAHDESTMVNEASSDVAFIESLGYDVSDIVSTDLGYLVEGDMLFTPEVVEALRSTPQTRHTTAGQLVSAEHQKYIYLAIGSMDGLNYLEAAITEWNSLSNCNINFLEGTGNATTMIAEVAFPGFPAITVIAPVNGKPATYVYFNPTHTDYSGADAAQKKYMWMHALGHAIGFGHTPNSISEAIETGMTHIDGSVNFNGNSIMRRDESPFTWEGFSLRDIETFEAVYPYRGKFYLSWYGYSTTNGWRPAFFLHPNTNYKAVFTFDPSYMVDDGGYVCWSVTDPNGDTTHSVATWLREFEHSFAMEGTYLFRLEHITGGFRNPTETYTLEVAYP